METRILKQWENPKLPVPPIPPLDFAFARARLTAFRSQEEWLTVFELIGYNSEIGFCMDDVYAHGNKLRHGRQHFAKDLLFPPDEEEGFPVFEEDEEGNILLAPLDFKVMIQGEWQHFTPTVEDYAQLGIDVQRQTIEQIDPVIKIMRFLAYTIPEELFLSDVELLEHLGRPRDLPRFLQLYEWHHPDYRRKEKPSDSPCLRSLAKALSHNNRTLYECSKELVNTHWSNWPDWP
jgi:hypothetical protein